jgi:hypothetical protein
MNKKFKFYCYEDSVSSKGSKRRKQGDRMYNATILTLISKE